MSVVCQRHLYICRESSTNQLLFMQNKPNFGKAKMNINVFPTRDYENIANWTLGENKPNSKPIQTQSNPISSKAKMSVNIYYTEDYENKWLRRVRNNKPNTNPNKAKFRTLFPLTARPVRKKMLSSNGARDYNGIFSLMSYFQRTPIERSWK